VNSKWRQEGEGWARNRFEREEEQSSWSSYRYRKEAWGKRFGRRCEEKRELEKGMNLPDPNLGKGRTGRHSARWIQLLRLAHNPEESLEELGK